MQHLGTFVEPLGAFVEPPGASMELLGVFVTHPGAFAENPGIFVERLGIFVEPFGGLCGTSWGLRDPPSTSWNLLGAFVEPPGAFVEPPATLVQHPGIFLESPRSLPCSRGSQAAAATGSRDRQQRQAAEIGCRWLLQSLPPAGSCDRQPLKKFHADFNNSFAWLGVGRSRPSNFLYDSAQAFTRFQNAMRDETRV